MKAEEGNPTTTGPLKSEAPRCKHLLISFLEDERVICGTTLRAKDGCGAKWNYEEYLQMIKERDGK
jgi:hypothetical protein